jgi:hypothetical protein
VRQDGLAVLQGVDVRASFPERQVLIARDTYPNLISTTQATFFEWCA